ncbi:MAG TPA: RDD family protein, partial [Thermoanaerobaculia bacterium]
MRRFDEVELEPVVFEPTAGSDVDLFPAPRHRRLFALLTDLSLFAALSLALSPFLPPSTNIIAITALGGFVLVISFYYFVGALLLWGKTVGGAIFDVRIVPLSGGAMSLKNASVRWAGVCLSLLTGGIG